MIKIIFLLFAFVSFCSMANNFDLPIVNSKKINDECSISFDGNIVSKHNCEYESPSFLRFYSLIPYSWSSLWVFQDAPWGNACEGGAIRIISMDSHSKIRIHPLIDYCSGKISILNADDKVEIKIFSKGGEVEIWIFDGEKLSKTKSSL